MRDGTRRHLRLVRAEPAAQELGTAVMAACLRGGGCPRAELLGRTAAMLGAMRPGLAAPGPDAVMRELGLLIARGDVDERDGRLVPGGWAARRAG